MLTGELPFQALPTLHLTDTVQEAMDMMNDNHITHLPLVDDEKFLGLVSEEDLMRSDDDNEPLSNLLDVFAHVSVKNDAYFLKAISLAADNNLSAVPVTDNDENFLGAITYIDLLKYASRFMSLNEPGGLIVLEVESNQYAFSEISKLVETNDAQITQLNTSNNPETGMMLVTIRINKAEVSDIIATFQRYEYTVKYYFGEEQYVNELRSNYDNLMNYLKF